MKNRIGLIFIVFRDITMLAAYAMAVYLENARGGRLFFMSALFLGLFVWMHIRERFLYRHDRILAATFIVDAVFMVLLDDSSKFVVNYYFNLYYFYVLICAGFLLKQKQRLIVSFALIAAAFIKYYRFIEVALSSEKYYNMSFVISYILFTFVIYVTIAAFFNYSRILREEKLKLDKLNQELKSTNELLEEKNRKIKELTIFEERNRIAREIHDSVGHNLTGLIMKLDYCEKAAGADGSKVQAQIASSKDIAKECLMEIRRSVQALKPISVSQLPLIRSIEELINNSRQKFGITMNLSIEGKTYKTEPDFNMVIYRAVQEAITNSVRHGKAGRVDISITFGDKRFHLLIKDNGTGAEKLKQGNGLIGMKERINEYKGDISFFTKNGFMINISIPVEGETG